MYGKSVYSAFKADFTWPPLFWVTGGIMLMHLIYFLVGQHLTVPAFVRLSCYPKQFMSEVKHTVSTHCKFIWALIHSTTKLLSYFGDLKTK